MNTTMLLVSIGGTAILIIVAVMANDVLDSRAEKRRRAAARARRNAPPAPAGESYEPGTLAGIEHVPVAVVPEPRPPDITLHRYRRRIEELEYLVDVLSQQLALRPPTDRIIVFLDVHGGADIETIAQAVQLDPMEVERRLRRELAEQVTDGDGNEWSLTVRAKDIDLSATTTWPADGLPVLEATSR